MFRKGDDLREELQNRINAALAHYVGQTLTPENLIKLRELLIKMILEE